MEDDGAESPAPRDWPAMLDMVLGFFERQRLQRGFSDTRSRARSSDDLRQLAELKLRLMGKNPQEQVQQQAAAASEPSAPSPRPTEPPPPIDPGFEPEPPEYDVEVDDDDLDF